MTRALVLFAHPCPESFSAALHASVVHSLTARGWEVDDCDLSAEGFSPVLTEAERRSYHDVGANTAPVQGYVKRPLWAHRASAQSCAGYDCSAQSVAAQPLRPIT